MFREELVLAFFLNVGEFSCNLRTLRAAYPLKPAWILAAAFSSVELDLPKSFISSSKNLSLLERIFMSTRYKYFRCAFRIVSGF